MRKLISLAAGLALTLTVFAAIPVSADPDGSNPNAAVIIRDVGCGVFDGNGVVVAAEGKTVINLNVGTVTCKVKGVANDTGRAVDYDSQNNPVGPGLACGVPPAGGTDQRHETISASGNVTLVCHLPI